MSYDLYCFRSTSGIPTLEEAENAIDADDYLPTDADWKSMNDVASALLEFDDRLERFDPDPNQLVTTMAITLEEAKNYASYIEINTSDDVEDYIQFSIYHNHVAISFGFGMTEEFISRLMEYVDVICRKTNYFLYDPQAGTVEDPLHPIALSVEEKQSWLDKDDFKVGIEQKPWWKFW